MVNGIVRLSRSEDAARYAKAIQQRVQALADAHTLLAERGWQEAPLDQIIRQQTGGLDAARVRISGPEVRVSAFVVQPLALALHELLDNAVRHGGLSQPDGTLEITWKDKPESGGFSLRWLEAGGPQPLADRAPGFGDAMLAGMVERQLRGELTRQWNDGRLDIVISIPGTLETLGAAGDENPDGMTD